MERRAKAHAAYAAGIVRQMRDDSGGMLDYWARSVEADPANVPLALEVARRRLIRRENPAAIAVLERVSSQSGKPVVGTVWSLLGLAYVQSGRTNDAIGAYRKGLGDQASRLGAYASLGRLLVESGRWLERVDGVLVIDCSHETQIARVQARNGWPREQILAIIQAQATREQRQAAADWLILNDGLGLDAFEAEVAQLAQQWGLPAPALDK
jgi:tetratricopeptide (TPR) repeat protein